MVLVATCFYIHEDHVLLQLYKNPLHYLRCTWHRFTKDRLLHPAFLLYLPSILPKSLFLTSLRSLGMHQRWLHGLQPTLSLPRLTCLTPYLPQNLSLPLFTVPSFLFSTHPLLPATHTHSCNNLKKKKHYSHTCIQPSFVLQFWAFTDNLSTAPTMHALLWALISTPGHICDMVTHLSGHQIKIWT